MLVLIKLYAAVSFLPVSRVTRNKGQAQSCGNWLSRRSDCRRRPIGLPKMAVDSKDDGKAKKKLSAKAKKSEEKSKKKEEIMKQLKDRLDEKKRKEKESSKSSGGGILDKLNPFQAGQNLRQTLGTLTTLGTGLDQETKQKYYLDDRFLESGGGVLSERNPYLDRLENNNYVPEVLVIGATGEVGRLVVRRLLLEGRFRVRVLVRDLYSQTLNLLGTGVTYCQGDLGNVESLEYALTDVDKIVFCAGAPRPDEADFQEKFQYFLNENLESRAQAVTEEDSETESNFEWEQLSSVLEVRAQLAEQIDFVGMQNLVRAYQNVRHADYGTSQAAKRSLFKFTSRVEDFGLFTLDDDAMSLLESVGEGQDSKVDEESSQSAAFENYMSDPSSLDDDEFDDYDENGEYEVDDEYFDNVEARRDATVKSQIQWIRNEFGHGVFVGKVPRTDNAGVGGEAGIVSSRLRSREDPENGIDLGAGFAGFIVRLVADGGNYEAFVRTGAYEETGIEYVCEFSTSTKPTSKESKSRNKFMTARLPFQNFKPVLRKETSSNPTVPPFTGGDIRYLGFRFRSASNPAKQKQSQEGEDVRFYMALSYMKVYRLQPEPEFVYLSDARIPPVVESKMVRHRQRKLLTSGAHDSEAVKLLDENELKSVKTLERSAEETYYKFRGEEVLRGSGLSYTIVRVAGFNEYRSGETSTIGLSSVSQTSVKGFNSIVTN